jgi:hypothetical protein
MQQHLTIIAGCCPDPATASMCAAHGHGAPRHMGRLRR